MVPEKLPPSSTAPATVEPFPTLVASEPARPAPSPTPVAGWADKTDEIELKKPFYLQQWFIKVAIVTLVLLGLGGGTVTVLFLNWRDTVAADQARQRAGLDAFLHSAAFATFARQIDGQLIAMHNFANARPQPTSALFPEIAAREKMQRLTAWPLEIVPVPAVAADDPARVMTALRTLTAVLAERGFSFDASRRLAGRHLFIRLLAPAARAHVTEHPENEFPGLAIDPALQEKALAAYAARASVPVMEVERAFAFYDLVGPAMWKEIERINRAGGTVKMP